jgi:hypothetical protein
LAGIDVSAGGPHLKWLARGLEELRHAEHLRLGLCERMQLGSARGIPEGEGGKLRRWQCLPGLINLRVACEPIVVMQCFRVLQVRRQFAFDVCPRELQGQPWVGDDGAICW